MDKAKYITTGISKGVLEEDFIETLRKEKRPFAKVKINDFYKYQDDYPLTFVPINFFIYPLKKDDKVLVYYPFNLGDILFPVLLAVDVDCPLNSDEELKKYSFIDDGDLVKFPSQENTVSFDYYSQDCYRIYTDKFVVQHTKNTVQVLTQDGKFYIYSKEESNFLTKIFNVEFSKKVVFQSGSMPDLKFELDAEGKKVIIKVGSSLEFLMDGNSNKIKITNGVQNLGALLSDLIQHLTNLTTVGSPVLHSVSSVSKTLLELDKVQLEMLIDKN